MTWTGSTRRRRLPRDWPARRARVLERDGHVCQLRYPVCTGRATDADHIHRGDDHRDTNLQAACAPCHRQKSSAEGVAARPRRRQPPQPHPAAIQRDTTFPPRR